VEGGWRDVPPWLAEWEQAHVRTLVHPIDVGSTHDSGLAEAVAAFTANRPLREGSPVVPALVAAVDELVRAHDGKPRPFVWSRSWAPFHQSREKCKVVLETMRFLRSIVSVALNHDTLRPPTILTGQEEPMSWKQKMESWFAAVAFAEEGEHKMALETADTRIPEMREAAFVLPNLGKAFAAAAFAEENCHGMASEILYGTNRRNSFLETIGLAHVKVWHGTAQVRESFVEAVGLGGARLKLFSIPV